MSDYGKRSVPVGAEALSSELMERWRARARSLLATGNSNQGAPEQPVVPQSTGRIAEDEVDAAGGTPQRRRSARQKTLLSAKVVFNEMMSVIDCAVRDLSESGARLKLNAPIQVPEVFLLRFNDGRARSCKVRRRNALEFGVEFIG